VHDKDLGDLWRLMAVADADETVRVIAEFVDHPEIGADVRQSVEWTAGILRDPVSVERAKLAFDTFVDPAKIERGFRRLERLADRSPVTAHLPTPTVARNEVANLAVREPSGSATKKARK
jgi:hypothetical protein